LIEQENHCFEVVCKSNKWRVQKRKNATDEEGSKSHGCAQYQCQNETGEVLYAPEACNDGDPCYIGECDEASGECKYDLKSGYDELVKQDNNCYVVSCEGNEWIVQKRQNATEWENQSNNGCIEYKCDNDTGPITIMCNNSNEKICVNDVCVENKALEEKVSVVIEMDEGVNLSEMNTVDELERIKALTEKGGEEVKIGYEINEQGYIIRIIIYVDDETTAQSIATTVESIEKGEGCSYGILCNWKDVHVKTMDKEISGTEGIFWMEMKSVLKIMVVIFILMRRM